MEALTHPSTDGFNNDLSKTDDVPFFSAVLPGGLVAVSGPLGQTPVKAPSQPQISTDTPERERDGKSLRQVLCVCVCFLLTI